MRNVLQRAAVQCRDGTIRAEDLPLGGEDGPPPLLATPPRAPAASLGEVERDYLRDLLARHQGHRRTVADLLGVTERTLYRKLKRHGLN